MGRSGDARISTGRALYAARGAPIFPKPTSYSAPRAAEVLVTPRSPVLARPPRAEIIRYGAFALVPVVLSLWVANETFYPTDNISELGWWAGSLGQALMNVAGVIGFPAIFVFLVVYSLLAEVLPDNAAVYIGASVGAVFGALFWGWLAAVIKNWVHARRAV